MSLFRRQNAFELDVAYLHKSQSPSFCYMTPSRSDARSIGRSMYHKMIDQHPYTAWKGRTGLPFISTNESCDTDLQFIRPIHPRQSHQTHLQPCLTHLPTQPTVAAQAKTVPRVKTLSLLRKARKRSLKKRTLGPTMWSSRSTPYRSTTVMSLCWLRSTRSLSLNKASHAPTAQPRSLGWVLQSRTSI